MNEKNTRHNYTGLSLTELLIVLSIIAVLASVATLSFHGSVNRAQLQNAADRLITDLRLVRHQTIRDQQSYNLQIDIIHRTYQAVGVTSLAGASDISVNLAATPYHIASMDLLLEGNSAINFDARGRATPAGSIVLHRGSAQITIKIDETGQIEQAN